MPKIKTIKQSVAFQQRPVTVAELYKKVAKGDTEFNPVFSTFAGLLQRINQSQEWSQNNFKRCQQFMYCLLTGAGALDNIIIVPIDLVLQSLKLKMERQTDIPKDIWDATISVIEKDKTDGTEFYIIDGQNRLVNAIRGYYENEYALGNKELLGIDNNNEEVVFNGKTYSELSKDCQEYIDNIELTVLVATRGNIDSFVDSLIAKNEGLPWTNWMKIMTKNWFSLYRNRLKDIANHPQVKETLNKVSGQEYAYDKNGHDKLISELLIWMEKKQQVSNDEQHKPYIIGLSEVGKSHYKLLQQYIVEYNKGNRESKPFSNIVLRNYVMLRYAMEHTDEFPNLTIPNIRLNKIVDFVSQYKIYNKNLKADKMNYLDDVNGVKSNVKRPMYYIWACSEKGQDFLECRLKLLFNEFKKNKSQLEKDQIIKTVVDTGPMPSMEEIYHNNPNELSVGRKLKPSEIYSGNFDRGHKIAKNNDGSNDLSNLAPHEKGHNRSIKDTNII